MPNYAIYHDEVILNVIIAESVEIAEEVTQMNAIETEGEPWIGWRLVDGEWQRPPMPEPVADENVSE